MWQALEVSNFNIDRTWRSDAGVVSKEGWREDWEVLGGYAVESTSPDSIRLKRKSK